MAVHTLAGLAMYSPPKLSWVEETLINAYLDPSSADTGESAPVPGTAEATSALFASVTRLLRTGDHDRELQALLDNTIQRAAAAVSPPGPLPVGDNGGFVPRPPPGPPPPEGGFAPRPPPGPPPPEGVVPRPPPGPPPAEGGFAPRPPPGPPPTEGFAPRPPPGPPPGAAARPAFDIDAPCAERRGRTLLMECARAGRAQCARLLIERYGARVELATAAGDADDGVANGFTALHAACFAGADGVARVLLAAGADAQARNRYGEDAAAAARSNGKEACAALVEAYVRHGGDADFLADLARDARPPSKPPRESFESASKLELVVVAAPRRGPSLGARFDALPCSGRDALALGRATANDVALGGDVRASKRHAEIAYFEPDGGRRGLCVRDVGSAHGTRVEHARGEEGATAETFLGGGAAPADARSPSRWLEIGLGDTIQIGDTTLALVRRTAPALAAASKPTANPQLARALVCAEAKLDAREHAREMARRATAVHRAAAASAAAGAAAPAEIAPQPAIGDDNPGKRMLRGMGWRDGEGLGKESTGVTAPIEVEQRVERAGLGRARAADVTDGDTRREAEWKRMRVRYEALS